MIFIFFFSNSLRRRAPITKASVQFRFDSDRDTPRPTSSSSNSSNASKGQNSNSGSVGGVDSQTLRRSERRRRPPKRPLDSEPSENDEALTDFSPNTKSLRRQTRRQSVPTRNAGRRTVRYREDSEDAATANYDDNDNENDDPSLTKKRRRPSSEAKRMRLNISSDDEESDRPTYSVSSRGRVRKLNHHSGTVWNLRKDIKTNILTYTKKKKNSIYLHQLASLSSTFQTQLHLPRWII